MNNKVTLNILVKSFQMLMFSYASVFLQFLNWISCTWDPAVLQGIKCQCVTCIVVCIQHLQKFVRNSLCTVLESPNAQTVQEKLSSCQVTTYVSYQLFHCLSCKFYKLWTFMCYTDESDKQSMWGGKIWTKEEVTLNTTQMLNFF